MLKGLYQKFENNGTDNSKLKDAKKRLKALEKIEQFRKEKWIEELKQLELQNALFEEHHKQEMIREQRKKRYFDLRKRELAEAQEQKLKDLKKEERKRKKEENKRFKEETKKKVYYDEQKLKLKLYKQKLEEHFVKMDIEMGGANFQSNSDLIIAKEDLASIPEVKHQESQNESVSTLVDRVGSVLDHHQKRKLNLN